MRHTCPYCNRKIEIVVRPVGGAAKPAPGGALGRLFGANRYEFAAQRFHQTAAPAVTFPRQEEPRALVDVGPGQTHTTETYRAPVPADVLVPGMWAGIGGVLLGAGSIFPTVARDWPWYVPFGVWLGSTAALWFAASTRILSRSSLLTYVEKLTRLDLDGDGYIGDEPPAYPVRGELVGKRNTIYTEFVVSDPWAWHQFCQEVDAKKGEFSKRHAVNCGMKEAEFDTIRDRWVSRDVQKALIDPASVGESKTLQLTRMGRLMVHQFAITPPPGDDN